MLKALELFGFKSFADKTRFEFPPGITVIVGPNGSGKSNIVDAIKWVLGEQSAKSLRGQDMADVIFKGSGAGGRKAMNTAEATLIFDNADRKLPIDAPEVHVTRRVYRSGEGEYLINRQPCRLKDIRDMFRGTGVGVDAYSLIEQGKVDRLLQASSKDRRAIFEEAAGISRFKAKKIEAQRRLERVEQNLLRLSDIVEEVENRLKTVRAQAGKARRYREYTERLQQLRTRIALVDWRRLSEQLAAIQGDLAAASLHVQSAEAEEQRLQVQQLELETAAAAAGEELRNCESQLAAVRHAIAEQQAASRHESVRSGELEEEERLQVRNLLAITHGAGGVEAQRKAAQEELAAAQRAHRAVTEELASREMRLDELAAGYEAARQQVERCRQKYVVQLQAAAASASHLEAGQAQLAAAGKTAAELRLRLADLEASRDQLAAELQTAAEQSQSLAAELAAHDEQYRAAENQLAEYRNLYSSRADDLTQLQTRRQGVRERAAVLEELERTREGMGAGVRQILADAGFCSLVRGVVADFVQVDVDYAAAIDAALGEAAQAVIFLGTAEQARDRVGAAGELAGRVVILPSGRDSTHEQNPAEAAGSLPSGCPASHGIELTSDVVAGIEVIARADKLVESPPACQPLLSGLLNTTFVVRRLDDALRLKQRAPAVRAVTLGGELVDEHGAIHFGPLHFPASLVSRRSQLRAARLELAVLDQQIADAHRETAHLKAEVLRHEQALQQLEQSGMAMHRRAADHRAQQQALHHRRQDVEHQQHEVRRSLDEAARRQVEMESLLVDLSSQLAHAQAAAEENHRFLAVQEQHLAELDRGRHQALSDLTAVKVEAARCQQRRESLQQRLAQFEDDQRQRERSIASIRRQICQARQRREQSQLAILAASARVAELALREEVLTRQIHDCLARQKALVAGRAQAADELAQVRRQILKLRDHEHELQLAAEQVRYQRQALADRLREDYGIELADTEHEPSFEDARERAAVEAEIDALRGKIHQIGAVNLDALEELDELEQRFATLSTQHKDLTEAKQSLERIIHKINADSRRLFLETLEAIRANFQTLYRKAFGGGKADLVLEEGVDVLESGIEIVATPPGKPSFSNSLLSGGEKALTAVALLLAIFQFRPSPFCVLDEVDAPFDEANISRFIDVLNEFLSWTRFVIVTHSKQTMTAATTLYGVTMQESGVSKRVSVRFEDVSDDGHIRREALDRAAADQPAENAA